MTWQQIICHSTLNHQDSITEVLENAGSVSVSLEDAGDQPVLEPLPGQTPLWDQLVITALYPIQADLTELLLSLSMQKQAWEIQSIRLEKLEDRAWVREWMDNFHPMRFGKNLWVYPSWRETPQDASIKILLDPGLAFGTGTHPTTALCLEWLDGEDLTGKRVLDYGCGSGILAIAAAKLGAQEVIGIDLDPQALEATIENARRNQLAPDHIKVYLPEDLPEGQYEGQYDYVVANILSGPLVQLADTLLGLLKPQGRLALSGILAQQQQAILAAYVPALDDIQIKRSEDWLRLSATKK